MIGRQLGHYRILSMLGAGGMGEVYRAHDERLDRDVALKILPASTFEDATARARLVREARAAAALNHASICTIHDVGEAEGQPYIAMELVEGTPLSEWAQGRALAADEVIGYGTQIADALAHAHARGVVHRDLKSANVVVTSDRRVKVLDFGLAKRMTGPELTQANTASLTGASLTERGSVVGTIAYMPPEQLRGEPADARSDVWALGVLLYEISAGTKPFGGQSTFEVSANILGQPPSPFPPAVPIALRGVIEKCLEKDPARRYQSATEARASLEEVRSGHAARWTSMRYHLARRPWLLPAVTVLIVAGILAALSLWPIRQRFPGTAPRVESLAVLPMVNLSGDSSQDYFADGMTEVLSTDLARLSGLKRVIARGSVTRYKGTSKPPEEIARELRVDALVTGSVVRSGDRVSITAQLLEPATGAQLWTNRYERSLQDVLVVRSEIVSAIVREIRMKLSPAEAARLAAAGPVNTEAFEAYLKGRFHWLKQTPADYDQAERYFQFALDKDPAYALAYAGLSSVWMMRGDAGFQPPGETFPKASAFMSKAFELDDSLADLHVAFANHLVVTQWNWAGAEREFKRAIFQRLLPTGPNKATNYLGLWGAYHRKGMYDRAVASAKGYFASAGDGEFLDALGVGGDAAAYRAGMKRAGEAMAVRSRQRHVPAIRIARMFAHAGEADLALQWLERAYENHESPLSRLGVVWDWIDLRSSPRFQELLRRLNLPL